MLLGFQAAERYDEALARFNEALTYCGSNVASKYHAGLMYYAIKNNMAAYDAFTAVSSVHTGCFTFLLLPLLCNLDL